MNYKNTTERMEQLKTAMENIGENLDLYKELCNNAEKSLLEIIAKLENLEI